VAERGLSGSRTSEDPDAYHENSLLLLRKIMIPEIPGICAASIVGVARYTPTILVSILLVFQFSFRPTSASNDIPQLL
jgi:hypothetical protein